MLSNFLKNFLKKYKILPILLSFILISFAIEFIYGSYFLTNFHGNWYSIDQDVVITAAYRLSKDNFYSNDFLTNTVIKLYPSQIFYLVSLIYNLLNNMLLTFFLLTLFLKTIFVISTFFLSKYLLKNEKLALLATFMLSFTHFMGPEEIGVTQVLAKNFVFAFMPLLFYFFFKYYKKSSAFIFILLGFFLFFHSITVLPVILLFLCSLIFEKKDLKLFFVCLIISSIFSFFYFKSTSVYQQQFDISVHYNPNVLLPPHIYEAILKFCLVVIPAFFIVKRKNKEMFHWFLILTLYSTISIFSLFNSDIALMQFFRSFKYVIYFSFIYSTLFVSLAWKKSKLISLVIFLLLFIPFSSLFYSTVLENITKSKNAYLLQTSNIVQLGDWIDKNTPYNSTLLIPPEWSEIKIWSRRAVVVTNYDSGWCAYSKDLAILCKERIGDVDRAFSQSSTEEFLKVAKKYDAQYIVTYNKTLDLLESTSVGNFRIYEVKQ